MCVALLFGWDLETQSIGYLCLGQDDMLCELVENGLSVQARSSMRSLIYKYSAWLSLAMGIATLLTIES